MTTTAASTCVNMLWDHRPGRDRFAGIVLQEYSPRRAQARSATVTNIFKGTPIGFTEAPHLYKRNGWYYLIDRRGRHGLGPRHRPWRARVTLDRPLRAAPRQVHPHRARSSARRAAARGPRLTSCDTQAGDTYAVYLCGRPLPEPRALRRSAARPRSRRWSGANDGWLRTPGWQRTCPRVEVARARPARASLPRRRPRARTSTATAAADRLPVAALAVPRRAVQPDRTPRAPPAVRPRDPRQPVPPVAGRAPPAGASATRGHVGRLRARAVPADGRAHLLLQRERSSITCTSRTMRRSGAMSGSCRRSRMGRQADAFTAPVPIPGTAPVHLRAELDNDRLYFAYSLNGTGLELVPRAPGRQHPLGRGLRARPSQLHRCVRRHGVPGHVGCRAPSRFRLLRVPRARVPDRPQGARSVTFPGGGG